MKMKIITPLTSPEDYLPLIAEGADEFYCGYTPREWLRTNKNIHPLNRRENIVGFNMTSFASLELLGRYMETYKVPISITLNSHYYSTKDYQFLESYIRELMAMGMDSFIVADIALICYLRDRGIHCRLTLSGDAILPNHQSLDFLRQFDLERIIFPRMYTIEDMANCITGNEQYSFEAFLLNSFCYYDSCMCNGLHCDEFPPSCMIPYNVKKQNSGIDRHIDNYYRLLVTNKMRKTQSLSARNDGLGSSGCGLCMIMRMLEIGIDSFKIVGRGFQRSRLIRDLRVINAIRDEIVNGKIPSDDFPAWVKSTFYEKGCPPFCFFPEDRQWHFNKEK